MANNNNSIEDKCKVLLRCGHACFGFKGEQYCPPCLFPTCCVYSVKQRASDICTICYTETLAEAPVLILNCQHVFHLHCLEAVLENRWVGPVITFNFMLCPLCQAPIKHERLEEIMKPLQELQDDVKRKAVTRLRFENLHQHEAITKPGASFYGDPEGFAMARYCYYQCYKCQKAYFGGLAECLGQSADHNPNELVCGGCSTQDRKSTCKEHGNDYIEFKCRYCCSIATYFCFGTTHFCTRCHQTPYMFRTLPTLPRCPAGPCATQLSGECPLKINHPPTGEEFSLGCAICANTQTF